MVENFRDRIHAEAQANAELTVYAIDGRSEVNARERREERVWFG